MVQPEKESFFPILRIYVKKQIYNKIIKKPDTDHVFTCAATTYSCGHDFLVVLLTENKTIIFIVSITLKIFIDYETTKQDSPGSYGIGLHADHVYWLH
jgi:hypothetical protein